MINRPILASLAAALAGSAALLTLPASAQQAAAPAAPSAVLSLCDIESRLAAQGITIREIELRDRAVEVEGRDAQGTKVELLMDRKSGEILSQKPDR
jgi:hypothetical protein